MGSLLRDSFGKEVGKRKWCETFAGPLVRRLSRSGGLSFIFSKEMLIFLCFFCVFLCLSGAPGYKKMHKKKHNSYHKKSTKKKQFIHTAKKHKKRHNSYHKKNPKKKFTPPKKQKTHNSYHQKAKKTQFIPHKKAKKTTIHTTKKHNSYHKKHPKKTQFISQKNTKKHKSTQFIPREKHTIHNTKNTKKKQVIPQKNTKKTHFIPQKKEHNSYDKKTKKTQFIPHKITKTRCRASEGAPAVVTFQTFYRGHHKTLKNVTLASGAISSSSSSACSTIWKCMRTYSGVAWRMCASAWERTAA